jgi:hypothetical protein
LTVTADVTTTSTASARGTSIPAKRSPFTAVPAIAGSTVEDGVGRRPRALRSAFLRTRLCAQAPSAASASARSRVRKNAEGGRLPLAPRHARRLRCSRPRHFDSREAQPVHGSAGPRSGRPSQEGEPTATRPRALRSAFLRTRLCAQAPSSGVGECAQSRVRKNAEGGRLTVTADVPDVYCSRPRHFGIPAKRSPSTAAGPAAVDRRRRASPRRRPRALRSAFLRTRLCAQAPSTRRVRAEPRSQERGRRALDRHGATTRR